MYIHIYIYETVTQEPNLQKLKTATKMLTLKVKNVLLTLSFSALLPLFISSADGGNRHSQEGHKTSLGGDIKLHSAET